ncbi:MAG: hypothetical protein J6S12_01975 [Alphaproteobacteria bacterium]|nr:hypothetical protein [Alphaproteobacteria bacterium]
MPYVKTEWETGDIITAAKLNNMEAGIEAAGVGVKSIEMAEADDTATLLSSWQEIKAAFDAKKPIFVFYPYAENMPFMVVAVYYDAGNEQYCINALDLQNGQGLLFSCTNEEDFPAHTFD